jgi:hypothetical protein
VFCSIALDYHSFIASFCFHSFNIAPSSFFLKAASLAALVANSGVAAVAYPYTVDPSDVYEMKADGTGFFDKFSFFTVSPDREFGPWKHR